LHRIAAAGMALMVRNLFITKHLDLQGETAKKAPLERGRILGVRQRDVHRVHEKNYNTVYVAITLANNVGF